MIETFYQRPNHRFIFHLIISSENKGFVYSYITREDCVSFFSYIKKEGKYYTFCFIKKFIRKSNMKYDKNGVGVSLLKKCKPSIGQQFTKKKHWSSFLKTFTVESTNTKDDLRFQASLSSFCMTFNITAPPPFVLGLTEDVWYEINVVFFCLKKMFKI